MDNLVVLEKTRQPGKVVKTPDGPVGVDGGVSQVEHCVQVVGDEEKTLIIHATVEPIVVSLGGDQSPFPVAGEGIEGKVSEPLVDVEDLTDILQVGFLRGIVQDIGEMDEVTPVILALVGLFEVGVAIAVRVRALVEEVPVLT